MKENFAYAAFSFANMCFFATGVSFAAPAQASELRLLMFEQPGCIYCARWDAEIGPVYPATDESRIAPLTQLDIKDPLPDGVVLDRPASLTPTFVLLDGGQEVGRMEGYPGEDFFWFLLGELIDRAGAPEN